jgi:CubicO group peptidase (beta-lactamase class C family)
MSTLDRAAVDALLTRARREVDDGLLPACQLALGLHGEIVLEAAFGDATPDTRFTIYSATKPFVASVIWQLLGEGLLDPSVRIAELIPEFGTNGKDVVTLDHVLQHTCGFPRAPLALSRAATHDGRREAFAAWRLDWEPGSRFEYHATSAHWVLAEVIHAVTGADHTEAVRRRVADPLGLGAFALGPPVDEQQGVATVVPAGAPASGDDIEAVLGVRELPVTVVTEESLLELNDPVARSIGLPGGGAVSTAADVATFYQALLHDPKGLWDPVVLADATSVVRNTYPDALLGHPINRTRGLVVAGDDGRSNMRGMGRTISPRGFGHNGAGGQIAWADPATGLSFCYLTNGLDRNVLREPRRTTAIASLAAVFAA